MIIAILGGTGKLGKGLALRLALAGYDVIIGSRDEGKAQSKAVEYSDICGCTIKGFTNRDAVERCDVAILSIPWNEVLDFVREHKDLLVDKIVVSPVVPMIKQNNMMVYNPPNNSMAEEIASILGNEKVVSAFQNVPAKRFSNLNETPEFDVIVCGDSPDSKSIVMEIINSIKNLRALDGGPLSNSRIVESLTPLLINISNLNKIAKELSFKLI